MHHSMKEYKSSTSPPVGLLCSVPSVPKKSAIHNSPEAKSTIKQGKKQTSLGLHNPVTEILNFEINTAVQFNFSLPLPKTRNTKDSNAVIFFSLKALELFLTSYPITVFCTHVPLSD